MRYFLAVARLENLNRAALEINVSAGSLSKAISRLEDELQTPLFFKSGRGIRLTPEGQLLRKRASQILQMEEDARLELRGAEIGSLNVYVSSEEILQTSAGLQIAEKLTDLYPQSKIQFLIRSESAAIDQVLAGEAHLALITLDPPAQVESRVLSKVQFLTCAGKNHPLVKKYGARSVPVEELLKHPFVAPDSAILGKIAKSSSIDGWRDDKFPRQIKYKVCGLKLMENLIDRGMALGYLPDCFVKNSNLVPLKVSGCPYTCEQTLRLICKDPAALGWLSNLWHALR